MSHCNRFGLACFFIYWSICSHFRSPLVVLSWMLLKRVKWTTKTVLCKNKAVWLSFTMYIISVKTTMFRGSRKFQTNRLKSVLKGWIKHMYRNTAIGGGPILNALEMACLSHAVWAMPPTDNVYTTHFRLALCPCRVFWILMGYLQMIFLARTYKLSVRFCVTEGYHIQIDGGGNIDETTMNGFENNTNQSLCLRLHLETSLVLLYMLVL